MRTPRVSISSDACARRVRGTAAHSIGYDRDADTMRLLFDINHPVQVHLFRPVLAACDARGHDCRVVAREKDVTLALLRAFDIPYDVLAGHGRGRAGFLRELVQREWRMTALARRFRPRLIVG